LTRIATENVKLTQLTIYPAPPLRPSDSLAGCSFSRVCGSSRTINNKLLTKWVVDRLIYQRDFITTKAKCRRVLISMSTQWEACEEGKGTQGTDVANHLSTRDCLCEIGDSD